MKLRLDKKTHSAPHLHLVDGCGTLKLQSLMGSIKCEQMALSAVEKKVQLLQPNELRCVIATQTNWSYFVNRSIKKKKSHRKPPR